MLASLRHSIVSQNSCNDTFGWLFQTAITRLRSHVLHTGTQSIITFNHSYFFNGRELHPKSWKLKNLEKVEKSWKFKTQRIQLCCFILSQFVHFLNTFWVWKRKFQNIIFHQCNLISACRIFYHYITKNKHLLLKETYFNKNFYVLFYRLWFKANSSSKSCSKPSPKPSGVRRIFKRGEGNLWIMHTKRKISPLRISSFFCPKLGEYQKKKGLHSDLVWFLAEK